MNPVKQAKGRAIWQEAEYLGVLAAAYRGAIDAARAIEKDDIADAWETEWQEVEHRRARLTDDAKALGYFGPRSV